MDPAFVQRVSFQFFRHNCLLAAYTPLSWLRLFKFHDITGHRLDGIERPRDRRLNKTLRAMSPVGCAQQRPWRTSAMD